MRGRTDGQRTFHPACQLMHAFITTPRKGKVEDAMPVNATGFLHLVLLKQGRLRH